MVRKTVPVVAEDLTVSEKAPLLMAEEQPLQVDTVKILFCISKPKFILYFTLFLLIFSVGNGARWG